MAKFFIVLVAFVAAVQVSLACPPYQGCGCGSKLAKLQSLASLAGLGGLGGLIGAAPVSLGSAMAEERVAVASPISLQPIEMSSIGGMYNPSPYYSRGCGCGARQRAVILPAGPSC